MREIKFRAKAGTQWRYGDLYHNERGELVIYEPKTSGQTLEGKAVDGWRIVVDPETVGQFTGIHDANGHEIYEGDIVKCGTGRICEVVYFLSPVHAGYDLNPVGGFDCKPPSEFSLWSDLTIIGNVHDNPELLEQKP